jgi:hypothetical protein
MFVRYVNGDPRQKQDNAGVDIKHLRCFNDSLAGLTVTDRSNVWISDSRWPNQILSLLEAGLWFDLWHCLGTPETGRNLTCFMKLGLGECLELSKYCRDEIPHRYSIHYMRTLK